MDTLRSGHDFMWSGIPMGYEMQIFVYVASVDKMSLLSIMPYLYSLLWLRNMFPRPTQVPLISASFPWLQNRMSTSPSVFSRGPCLLLLGALPTRTPRR